MKTIEEVRRKYVELLSKYQKTTDLNLLSDRDRNRLNKEASFLSFVIKYLDSSPREEWLLKEKNKLELYLNSIDPRFDDWRENTPQMTKIPEKEARAIYYKKMLKAKKEKQLKTINYILS